MIKHSWLCIFQKYEQYFDKRKNYWLKWAFLCFKVNYDKAIRESQQLIEENESLRNRLRDVINSPLSDAEKQQIIDDSQHRLHSSAPASIALPNVRLHY